jgi:DNA-binding PadR family transcriptional regulator
MGSSSFLEYALLGLLRQKPQSGYDLRKQFAATPLRHFSDSPGSIYPALRRLQARHRVGSTAEKNNARKRQEFAVTAAGTRALIAWLRQPVGRDDVIWRLDELTLRFALLDGNVERSDTMRFLEDLEHHLADYLHELRQYERNFDPTLRSTTGYLAFKHGVDSYQAELQWVRHVRKEFAEVLS